VEKGYARGRTGNAGVVTFHRLSDTETRVMLQLEVYPEGAVEKVGDLVGAVDQQVKADLKRCKEFIESRGQETGGWQGQIESEGRPG